MKRQVLSSVFVVCAIALLYFGGWFESKLWRIYSEISSGGFRVEYFKGINFDKYVCSRSERRAIKAYGAGRPARGVYKDGYSARWQGVLRVPEDGEYSFSVKSMNGARLLVNGDVVVDNWNTPGWQPGSHAQISLQKGTYPVVIEHFKSNGEGALRVCWAGGPVPSNTVLGAPYVTKR